MLFGNKFSWQRYLSVSPADTKRRLTAFHDWVKRLQKCVSVKGDTLKVCNKNMFDKRSVEVIRTQ